MTERLHFCFSLSCIGEGNGNPLQCCCLENARDGGAWWAVVDGVTQSRTRLKRLSSIFPSLIPAHGSSSSAFPMRYSAYKLNKQGDDIQPFEPVHYSMSGSNCCFLTCILISQETGKVILYSHLFKNFSSLL